MVVCLKVSLNKDYLNFERCGMWYKICCSFKKRCQSTLLNKDPLLNKGCIIVYVAFMLQMFEDELILNLLCIVLGGLNL